MFKDIPGNSEFQISLEGKIINKINTGRNPVFDGDRIVIEMFGNRRIVDVSWLALIAHFEVFLPMQHQEKIWAINFQDIGLEKKSVECGKVMIIKPSLLIYNKYRIIPSFTNYAISKEGEIINIKKEKLVKINGDYFDYPTVNIYNPDKSSIRTVLVHRLVALAWCYNKDYFQKPIINHKNGDKKIYHFTNLEWCSYRENNLHAFNTGLRTDNKECKVYDVIDKKVIKFSSIKQACAHMGIRDDVKLSSILYKTKHRLINKRYELKLLADNSAWFYQDKEVGVVSGRYNLTVTLPDGTVQEHPDLRTFKKCFKVWNVSNINDVVEKAKSIYPGIDIVVKDNYVLLPIQAYNLETKQIIEAEGIRQLSRLIDKDFSAIRLALIAGEKRIHQGYAFRYKTDEPWVTDFAVYKSSSKCVLARHKETNEELKFSSLREASKHFSIDRSVIRRCLKNGRPFRLWKLSETES